MDFASLTPDQKQAVICAQAIKQYAHSILNSASLSEKHSESSALVKLYACFLTVDDTAFHRSDNVRYQCLAQLAGTFDNYDKYSSMIADTCNRYVASWNARRIRFADDPYAKATINNFPSLLCMVAEDLQSDGYSIDALFLSNCAVQYCSDFVASNPAKSAFPDDSYLDKLNKAFDELEDVFPVSALWKAMRQIAADTFRKHYDEYFSDEKKRPTPHQYAIEYTLVSWIGAFGKEPFTDSSGHLTEMGEQFRDLAFQLGDYGVRKKYITDSSWQTLRKQLVDKTGLTASYPTVPASKNTSSGPSLTPFVLVFILAFALMLIVVFGSSSRSTSATVSATSPAASVKSASSLPTLTPEIPPQTGLLYSSSYDEELAPFTITANSENNYLLRLCDGRQIVQSYYIRAGETLTVHVPLGEYSLYYACAPSTSSWFGESNLWGTHTAYYKSSELYNFSFDGEYYNGYTLNLLGIASPAGNLETIESSSNVWNSLY